MSKKYGIIDKARLNEVREIIKSDCKIISRYYRDGETCAIGALAQAAGVSDDILQAAGDRRINVRIQPETEIAAEREIACTQIRNAVCQKFTLTPELLDQIQRWNDSIEGLNSEAIQKRRNLITVNLDKLQKIL